MNPEKAVHGGDAFRYGDVLEFSSNVNPFGPSRRAMAVLKKALADIQHYPDPDATRLKEAVGRYVGAGPECVTLGNGSTEVIKNFCEACIGPGDRVVVPIPTFSEYGHWLAHYGAEVVKVPMGKGFTLPTDAIIARVKNGARAVFLCNPNNPTGRLISGTDMEAVLGAAAESGTLVLVDEAYIEFTNGESLCGRACSSGNILVLRSLTKFFSLAGLRVGFAVGGPGLVARLEAVRVPWNVNWMAIEASLASLEDAVFIEGAKRKIEKEKAYLGRGLSRLFDVVPSDANFFLADLAGKGVTAPELKKRLLMRGVLVRDCTSFEGLAGEYFRVSIRKRRDNRYLLESLGAVLEGRA